MDIFIFGDNIIPIEFAEQKNTDGVCRAEKYRRSLPGRKIPTEFEHNLVRIKKIDIITIYVKLFT